MKKQTINVSNAGNQEGTVDVIIALAEMGFDVKCVMLEHVSMINADREFASDEPEATASTIH